MTVALPVATAVTVIVVPDKLTVAIDVSDDTAEIAPSPVRVTVIVSVRVDVFKEIVVGLMERLPAAFAMLQVAVFAVVVPSNHVTFWLISENVIVYVPAFVADKSPVAEMIVLSYALIVGDCAEPL